MGSLTDEQLLQMVRDFIESESESTPTTNSPRKNHKPRTRCLTLQKILWDTTVTEVEVLQQILKHAKPVEFAKEAGASATNLKKLVVMKLKAEGYEASLCKTSWDSTFDCSEVFHFTGGYEYIDVMMGEKHGVVTPTRLIVDLDFRSQFELARPTRAYKELIELLPCVFVGTEAKLIKIISLLCSAAKESLKEKGLHIPPWRKATYMQSKWLSKNCKKISFTSNNSQFECAERIVNLQNHHMGTSFRIL